MMNVKKTALLISLIVVFIIAGSVFLIIQHPPKNDNEAEQFYAVNQLNLEYSYILVVSEESRFKNNLVKSIAEHFYSRPILLSVIDEAELTSTNEDLWDKVIIVTSAHNDDVVYEIDNFINHHKDPKKVCLVVTTDSGEWNGKFRDGIDVITTTSKLKNASKISGEIIEMIDLLALQ